MPALSEKNRAKTVDLSLALSDETQLHILDRLKESEHCLCDLTMPFRSGSPVSLFIYKKRMKA